MGDTKRVHVAGCVELQWTVELPEENKYNGGLCDDPAKEAVIEALPQFIKLYLWGEAEHPAYVHFEIDEEDIEIEEDDR